MRDDDKALEALIRFAGTQPLTLMEDRQEKPGDLLLRRADAATRPVRTAVIRQAMASGLLERHDAKLLATPAARLYLRRRLAGAGEDGFAAQHREEDEAEATVAGQRHRVRVNRHESPLGALIRMKDRHGQTFLPEEAVEAGERLHADFMRGQLQPRVTASWEPRLSNRGDGARGGVADLTDSTIAARNRVNRAIEAMGPELSGVALDVCCFMKGLEIVERERQWPARSAKLMLRTALLALSRHYRPPASNGRQTIQHWGAEGYRPPL